MQAQQLSHAGQDHVLLNLIPASVGADRRCGPNGKLEEHSHVLILLWHFLQTDTEVSPLTAVIPGSECTVEHVAQVGINLLVAGQLSRAATSLPLSPWTRFPPNTHCLKGEATPADEISSLTLEADR